MQLKAELPLQCKEILCGKTNPSLLSIFPSGIPKLGEKGEQYSSTALICLALNAPQNRNRSTRFLLQPAVSSAQLGLHPHLPRGIFLSLVTLEAFIMCRLISLRREMPWEKLTRAKAYHNFNIRSSGSQAPFGLTQHDRGL